MNASYSVEISRKNPTCIMFLLDQSYSMNDAVAGDAATRKADAAAEAINDLLLRLILRCTKGVGAPRNYFEVGVIGYGAARGVGPSLGGALTGSALVSISKLADNPLRVEKRTEKKSDGSGGQVSSGRENDPKTDSGLEYYVCREPGQPGADRGEPALLVRARGHRRWSAAGVGGSWS